MLSGKHSMLHAMQSATSSCMPTRHMLSSATHCVQFQPFELPKKDSPAEDKHEQDAFQAAIAEFWKTLGRRDVARNIMSPLVATPLRTFALPWHLHFPCSCDEPCNKAGDLVGRAEAYETGEYSRYRVFDYLDYRVRRASWTLGSRSMAIDFLAVTIMPGSTCGAPVNFMQILPIDCSRRLNGFVQQQNDHLHLVNEQRDPSQVSRRLQQGPEDLMLPLL